MGCRFRTDADALTRIVAGPEGSLQAGRTLPGRGAWVCTGSLACLELARTKRAFERALRAPVHTDAPGHLASTLGWEAQDGRTDLVPPTGGARG